VDFQDEDCDLKVNTESFDVILHALMVWKKVTTQLYYWGN